ncbi:hypothetical protein HOT57_gp62 [Pseudomonas phage phCDa]|uniref:Uncharacterized protein n=1 Tax=Pseudomonas phage phCDa TaxID=2268587 RepID=A0A2Z5H9Z0_9CAUD|nr:hypothetical protein HOT57_gp62 [Pseudomonas phage phCDa]AXC36506.1 hypothetical protein phCDa_62 [Pseudomonas phage phCDa]
MMVNASVISVAARIAASLKKSGTYMAKPQNLPVPKKAVDKFIASMNGNMSPAEQATAARELIDALKKATALVEKGINRKELTVCDVKLGYVCPNDVDRFLREEIPRLTVYRSKKHARNMGVFSQRPPKAHKERQACKTQKKSTVNTTTGTRRRAAKPSASSTQ